MPNVVSQDVVAPNKKEFSLFVFWFFRRRVSDHNWSNKDWKVETLAAINDKCCKHFLLHLHNRLKSNTLKTLNFDVSVRYKVLNLMYTAVSYYTNVLCVLNSFAFFLFCIHSIPGKILNLKCIGLISLNMRMGLYGCDLCFVIISYRLYTLTNLAAQVKSLRSRQGIDFECPTLLSFCLRRKD